MPRAGVPWERGVSAQRGNLDIWSFDTPTKSCLLDARVDQLTEDNIIYMGRSES